MGALAMGRLSELDAVTLDAYGTLLELRGPVGSLARLLPEHDPAEVERAFRAEVEYYVPRSHHGRDGASLARLQRECADVFNDALGSSLSPEEYVAALEYEFLPGALETVAALSARGLSLAIVANWDIGLVDRLAPLGIPVCTSAEAGAPKPDPAPFQLALERLGVRPERTLHIGDSRADADGAAAANLHFAWAPVAEAVAQWT